VRGPNHLLEVSRFGLLNSGKLVRSRRCRKQLLADRARIRPSPAWEGARGVGPGGVLFVLDSHGPVDITIPR
jgi:hypothetical protein